MWRFKEECDRLEWKFRAGRLTHEEMRKFCSVFAITHLVGFSSAGGGLPISSLITSVNTTNFVLFTALGSPAFPVDVRHTINSGVYVYSTSTATPGYDLGTGWAAGSIYSMINGGFILGRGGKGASGFNNGMNAPGAGGSALVIRSGFLTYTIDNNGAYIAGGGGGGGGIHYAGGGYYYPANSVGGGGGAGAGDGGDTFKSGSPYGISTGGAGGSPGVTGADGGFAFQFGGLYQSAGGGGGRILPGLGGAGASGSGAGDGAKGGGAGGGGGLNGTGSQSAPNGGGSNSAGGNSASGNAYTGGGGGGWGASGGSGYGPNVTTTYNGAAGGNSVVLNGQTIIWVNVGNRYGTIS